MTNLSKIISLASLLVVGATQTGLAQTQTDEVLVLNFELTAISQGAMTTGSDGITSDVQVTKITSKGIIQVLGAATGNNFSHKAKLVALAPLSFLDEWTIQIRDGTNTKVDVTGFFGHQPGFPSVNGSWTDAKSGVSGITDYSVDGFILQDQGGLPMLAEHFSVSGLTVINSTAVLNKSGTVVGQNDSIAAHVAGTGDIQGTPVVITGTIKAEGIGTEAVSSPIPTS